ncbi:hypothetical protein GmHk_04G011841 [Glycine max]|nr:hypothetical protein GmHk_04G011841 [Glycine max]
MSYLCAMQQQGGNNSQHRRPRRIINRNCEDGHLRLLNDYFSENSRLNSNVGSQCNDNCLFKLSTLNYNEYFQMRYDVVGRLGLSPLQKCTIVIRILAYGSPADCLDEYKFVRGVNEIFGQEYLRRPDNNDINHLLQIGDAQGFSDMLGSNNDINVLN